MKSTVCKEVLGQRTFAGASSYSITRSIVPDGTRTIMLTFNERPDTGVNGITALIGNISFLLDTKNIYFLDWIWSNTSYQIDFNSAGGAINNFTVVYLR